MYGDFPLENNVFLASLRFFFDAFLKEIALLQRRMIKKRAEGTPENFGVSNPRIWSNPRDLGFGPLKGSMPTLDVLGKKNRFFFPTTKQLYLHEYLELRAHILTRIGSGSETLKNGLKS